jgi:hypothetical protein
MGRKPEIILEGEGVTVHNETNILVRSTLRVGQQLGLLAAL